MSPDLSPEDRRSIASIVLKSKDVDGLIVANTTVERPSTLVDQQTAQETGGLSGAPLKEKSTTAVHDFYALTKGKVSIIGCGGVENGRDAYEKIRAGASAVQLYTALVYQGFPVVKRVKRELVQCLEADGFKSVNEAVGADHCK